MSGKAVRRLLLMAAVLIVWGPPALRLAGRELDAALANPFALDGAAFLQVGAWIFADALVLLLVLTHLARGTRLSSDLLSSRPVRWYGLYGLLGIVSMTYSSSPIYTAFFAHKILLGILLLALLEWHWPARHGSRAMQVLLAVSTLQAVAIGVLYFVDREWVTPFGSGDGREPVRVTGGVFADYGSSGGVRRPALPHGAGLAQQARVPGAGGRRLPGIVVACRAVPDPGVDGRRRGLPHHHDARPSAGPGPGRAAGRRRRPRTRRPAAVGAARHRVGGNAGRRRAGDPVRPDGRLLLPDRTLAGRARVGLRLRRRDQGRADRLRRSPGPQHRRRARRAVHRARRSRPARPGVAAARRSSAPGWPSPASTMPAPTCGPA